MIEIGKFQTMIIDHFGKPGAFLIDPTEKNELTPVLLPQKEIPKKVEKGDKLKVFIYLDSDDRLIATTRKPLIELDQIRILKVTAITRIGAFLNWGLEKELLLPYKEQITKVQIGRSYPVYLYLDKSQRLCATMKIFQHLKNISPYQEGDWVNGYIYQINPELGAFVAIDLKYHGLIHIGDMQGQDLHCGDEISARVVRVRADGKLALSPRKKAYKEISKDAKTVLFKLNRANGFLPFNDRSSPTAVAEEFHMSKSAFKRALGNLMKINQIKQTDKGIEIIPNKN